MATQHSAANDSADIMAEPRLRSTSNLDVLKVPSFAAISWLIHGFSTRAGGQSTTYSKSPAIGELNLGFTTSDHNANVVANRESFVEAVTGNPQFPLVTLCQIHSAAVLRIQTPRTARDSGFAEADGMMTNQPGILLAIQTADCIPILVADTKQRAVAGFHAGWRGTLQRIAEHGVEKMHLEFGSRPEDLVAAIGPGIGSCCYAVGTDVYDQFHSQFSCAAELFHLVNSAEEQHHPGNAPDQQNPVLHLDLLEANRRQLLNAGLNADAIALVHQCTSCNTDRFFSYRAERGVTGRMLSVIGIRPE